MKKGLMWIISLAVTILLLIVIFRRIEPEQLRAAIAGARPLPLLAALVVSFLTNCWLAAVKWRKILAPLDLEISTRESFLIKMGSGPLKSVLPFRSGEASRVIYLKRRHNFSAARATGSILIELAMNILVFLLFILAGALTGLDAPPKAAAAAGLILAAGAAFFIAAGRKTSRRWVQRILSRIPGPRLRGGLETLITFPRFFSPGQLGPPLLLTLIIQGGKLFSFFLLGATFRVAFPLSVYLVILPVSILIATVPVTFLGIGLREWSLAELVPLYSALPAEAVLAPALAFSAVEYVFPVLLGLVWTGRFTRGILERPARGE